MSACSLFERISVINSAMDNFNMSPANNKRVLSTNPSIIPNGINPGGPGPGPGGGGGGNNSSNNNIIMSSNSQLNETNNESINMLGNPATLERDYYGCYCLKFIVKNGTHITEDKVQQDFGQLGDVVDVRGPGLFSGLRGNHVYVRYVERGDAEEALKQLSSKYHQLTPASISDVLPDNYGLYTISFYNKTGIPSSEVRKEFSKFGEVKNLTGSLDVKGGRVFVSYKEKVSAVQALQAFFFRKDKYPNMKFALPRCEKDYFGCYCLKFYNKSGDVTEDKVLRDFGQFGEVVDVRGPGLFDVTGDDVYVRYKEKSSAEQALIELVGKYDSLCLAPPSDIQADKFGYFTITFVNDKCLSKSDVWYIFSKFGTVACVNGTFDCKKGRVFVSYKEKQGALNALETMLITKEYHLQVSKNSTVRKNDYNVVGGNSNAKEGNDITSNDFSDFNTNSQTNANNHSSSSGTRSNNHSSDKTSSNNQSNSSNSNLSSTESPSGRMANGGSSSRELSRSRESSLLHSSPSSSALTTMQNPDGHHKIIPGLHHVGGNKNGLVKFNRNVEKDIFGYFCLSFLNEDGDINEKKVRHDFGKFGEVVSVRGALGKQKGHVFVRFRRKEAAENCLNCLNSFPLSEMSELFGKYLFLSPATPRDIDCDMYGLYSISFLNLNIKSFREIRQEFARFGEIVRLTSGGGGNTDELVSISYPEKTSAIKALQTHFTNKEFPYLDIAKGSSLLLVNSSDSSDNEDNESDYIHHHHRELQRSQLQKVESKDSASTTPASTSNATTTSTSSDPFHDPPIRNGFGGSDVVDELLKPFQSYFNIYRTGQYHSLHGEQNLGKEFPQVVGCSPVGPFMNNGGSNHQQHLQQQQQQQQNSPNSVPRSPDKKYRIKSMKHPLPHSNGLKRIENGSMPNANQFSVPPPNSAIIPNHPPPAIVQSKPQVTESSPPQRSKHQISPLRESHLFKQTSTPTTSATSTPLSSSQTSPERELLPVDHQTTSPTMSAVEIVALSKNEEYLVPTNTAVSTKMSDPEPDFVEEEEEKEEKKWVSEEQIDVECLSVHQDLLGHYSLSFPNKLKDLSERKLRQDFGTGNVTRVRGLAGLSKNEIGNGEVVTISFSSKKSAQEKLRDLELHKKYPGLRSSPKVDVKSDKDGAFSIEFINSGMNGIREITNEFSRHGEVVKVMAGGAKNAVKRVTVSYARREAALEAVKACGSSKDFVSVDFARECLEIDQ